MIFLYPLVFDAPVRGGVLVGPPVWFRRTRMMGLPDGEKVWRYLYPFWQNIRTWQTDTHTQTDIQTDGRTPHDDKGRAWCKHRAAMTSYRISRWQISASLNFRVPVIGSLKSPCTTSYRLLTEAVALNCLFFWENRIVAFWHQDPRWRISAILNFRGLVVGSLKNPYEIPIGRQ